MFFSIMDSDGMTNHCMYALDQVNIISFFAFMLSKDYYFVLNVSIEKNGKG